MITYYGLGDGMDVRSGVRSTLWVFLRSELLGASFVGYGAQLTQQENLKNMYIAWPGG